MILNMVPEKQLYSELRSLEPWPGKKHMGRPRDNKAWGMVVLLPNKSKRWICPHCKNTYAGDVTRVKRHLARTGGGGIVPCPDVTPKIQQDALELLQAQAATATARKDELPIQKNEIHQMQTQNHATPTRSWQVVPNYRVPVHQYRENTESYESLIQTNEIHQMQTQNHATPTGSWQVQPNYAHQYWENTGSYGTPQVQPVTVPNYAHQYWENTGSYGTPQVQPVAVSQPIGEPNQDAGLQVSDYLPAGHEDFNDMGPGSFQM